MRGRTSGGRSPCGVSPRPIPKSGKEFAQYARDPRIQRKTVRVQERLLAHRLHGFPNSVLAAGVRQRPPRHYTRAAADETDANAFRFRRQKAS